MVRRVTCPGWLVTCYFVGQAIVPSVRPCVHLAVGAWRRRLSMGGRHKSRRRSTDCRPGVYRCLAVAPVQAALGCAQFARFVATKTVQLSGRARRSRDNCFLSIWPV